MKVGDTVKVLGVPTEITAYSDKEAKDMYEETVGKIGKIVWSSAKGPFQLYDVTFPGFSDEPFTYEECELEITSEV